MKQSDAPHFFVRFGGLIVVLLLSIASISWSTWSIYSVANQVTSETSIIHFNKGSFYLLGGGISLTALTFDALYGGLLGRRYSKKITNIVAESAVGGFVLMFIFPQLFHYFIDDHLAGKGYIECSEASYHSARSVNIAYTNNQLTCDDLAKERENRWKR